MKRKIIKKGNAVMYLTDGGKFKVYRGQWHINSWYDFSEAAGVFCEIASKGFSHKCYSAKRELKCSTCFLGKITGRR
jgi:hypothetical protein